jgi:hypothetical protein
LNLSKWVAGALGSLVVVLQGIQQLHQFQDQWLAYRSTWQALYREQHLYEAKVGDYASVPNPPALLAERMENLQRLALSGDSAEAAQLELRGSGPACHRNGRASCK